MATTIATLPGYKMYEYLLVLSPHEELRQRILQVKEAFSEKYKGGKTFLKPHIALVQFATWSMMEDKLLHRLQAISLGIAPFKTELRDYKSYPSHTIYINVTTKLPVQDLVQQLKSAQRLMKGEGDNKPHFMEEPHITVARKLKPWQYEGGWLEYSHRQFTGRFIADSMLLLKRAAGDRNYQVAQQFQFMNLPVTTKQGSLFAQ